MSHEELNDQLQVRREKLDKLRGLGTRSVRKAI